MTRRRSSSSGSGRATRRSGPGRTRRDWLGWLDEPCADARGRRAAAAVRRRLSSDRIDAVVLLGMGGSSLAPEVLAAHVRRRDVPRPRHDASAGDPRPRGADRPRRARSSSRPSKSGSTLETRSHTDYFWEQSPDGAHWSPRSPTRARRSSELARGARASRAVVRRRADDRRPLLGALAVRDGAGGADGRRRGAAPARARSEMAEACRLAEGNPGLELGLSLGEGWREGRDKVCIDPTPGRLRPLGRAAARRVDRQAGQGPRPGARRDRADGPDRQAQEVRRRRPVRARPGVLPLGVRDRGRRLDPRHQSVRPARRAGGQGQDEARCSPPATSRGRAGGLGRGAVRAGAKPGDYVCIQAFVNPTDGERARSCSSSPSERAQATGCVVTHGFGPRYLHSTGQLHKGGPTDRLFLQVVDDTATSSPIPGQPFGFGRLIRAQAAGDFESLRERGRRVARIRSGGGLDATRNDRARPHGRQHDEAARGARPRGEDVRPGGRVDGEDARGAPRAARGAAHVLDDGPGRRDHREDVPAAARACSSPATRSSTAATRTSTTRSAGTRRRGSRRSRSSTPASPAASGGSQDGYCLMVGGDDDGGRAARADLPRRSRPTDGYAHVGAVGRRALREDGAQRDRVRPDAGLRRGLRGDEGSEFDLDLHEIAGIWRYGSVVRSWLLELLLRRVRAGGRAARGDPRLRRGLRRGPLDDRTRRSPRTCRCR